jgi:hypothetical protein
MSLANSNTGITPDFQLDIRPNDAMQTNIEIPDDVADELFRRAPQPGARSALVEKLLQEYFRAHPAACSELDLINDHADELNAEAHDVLEYQVIP